MSNKRKKIGDLRDRVEVLAQYPYEGRASPDLSTDDYDGITEDDYDGLCDKEPSFLYSVWASVRPGSGRRFYESGAEGADFDCTVLTRCNPKRPIRTDMLLCIGGTLYDIVSVEDEGNRHRFLWIKCKSIKNA